ncbi:hypothetical protein AVEN_52460-1 [Araneus ventricosus]|uniref:Uncharacterized protein n=1 Tax=Araneus ventricosus TaxID=182803 RepID=A0A4Y2CW58_ARAVE|nr:hypothetical protein AVEN_52460-1 [Araneus ventricosus]
MDLFIELKNEFASFRHDVYNKVDGFSKLLNSSTDSIQSDEPLSPVSPSLQQEIFEAVVKSKEIQRTLLWLNLPLLYPKVNLKSLVV